MAGLVWRSYCRFTGPAGQMNKAHHPIMTMEEISGAGKKKMPRTSFHGCGAQRLFLEKLLP